MRRDHTGRARSGLRFQAALIEIGCTDFDRDTRIREQSLPCLAARGQHERFPGKP
jgi:hypothetical protein